MSDFESLKNELLAFRDERDWKQFHNSKDLAMAISIESNELLELFLWKDPKDANEEKINGTVNVHRLVCRLRWVIGWV